MDELKNQIILDRRPDGSVVTKDTKRGQVRNLDSMEEAMILDRELESIKD